MHKGNAVIHQSLERRPHLIPAGIAALMLLGALGDWPYGYYQLLRFVVCGAGTYIAWLSYHSKYPWAVWLFAFVAILFNPLAPVHLSRATWGLLDLFCAGLFLMAAAAKRQNVGDQSSVSP
jgi:hypothetical protein